MKKILSLLGAITLIGTSTTGLVACNKSQYSEDELKKEKEKHKIDTANQELKNNLEWIVPQEKSFNQVDNKWYFVIWHGNEKNDWHIAKFKFNNSQITNIDKYDKYIIQCSIKQGYNSGLMLVEERNPGNVLIKRWEDDNKQEYFKSVYRWNLNTDIPDLDVNNKTGEIKVK